mgnify:CR=1 FL=1
MKTEDLKAQGLTDAQIAFVMAENGRDIANVKKDIETLTADRDKWKEQAETAETTLKGFDGINVEQLKTDIESWKKKAEEVERDYQAKIADRDFSDSISEAIRAANGRNVKAIRALLDEKTLRESKNQKEDISAALKILAEAEDSKMLFGVQQVQQTGKPKFTQPTGQGNMGGTVTKESIMAIKDRNERRKMIAEHMELFAKE